MRKPVLLLGGTLVSVLVLLATWGGSAATNQSIDEELGTPKSDLVQDNYLYLPITFRNHPKDTIFGYEWSSISTSHGLDEMASAGASWVRRAAIWWPDIEPTKGSYDWSAMSGLEAEFIRARDNNMKVIIVVRGTPDWAWADPPFDESCGRVKTSEFGTYASFMAELVRRYSGPPYYVKYWELGNEPEVDPRNVPPEAQWMGCWGNMDEPLYGGGYYADMLEVVYPAMKAVDPTIEVMVGGLLMDCDYNLHDDPKCDSLKFFEGILANGGGAYFDGVSFHAYDYYLYPLGAYRHLGWASAWNTTGPVLIAKVDWLVTKMSDYSVTGKFLMNTEAALLCDDEWGICDADFETTKAYYVAHSYVSAMSKGLESNLWYFWMSRNAGLLETDLDPLPAYTAYAFAREELRDATYNREITDHLPDVRLYEFNNRGGRIWVLWSLDGTTHTGFSLGGTPAAIYDVFGNPIAVSSSIDVGLMPVYVEWDS